VPRHAPSHHPRSPRGRDARRQARRDGGWKDRAVGLSRRHRRAPAFAVRGRPGGRESLPRRGGSWIREHRRGPDAGRRGRRVRRGFRRDPSPGRCPSPAASRREPAQRMGRTGRCDRAHRRPRASARPGTVAPCGGGDAGRARRPEAGRGQRGLDLVQGDGREHLSGVRAAAVLACALVLASACVGPTTAPAPARVFLIVMENHTRGEALQGAFTSELAARYGVADNYHAVAHPSVPNYLALPSGQTWGVTDDSYHALPRADLGDQLTSAGIKWRAYMEGLTDAGCIDSPPPYDPGHNPFAFYGGGCPDNVVPFSELGSD